MTDNDSATAEIDRAQLSADMDHRGRVTGELNMYRKGALQPTVDIETGPKWTVTDSPSRGLALEPYRAFTREAEEEGDTAAVPVGTDDKVDAGPERIRILKSHPIPIVPTPPVMTPDRFMLIGTKYLSIAITAREGRRGRTAGDLRSGTTG
jgi:hypothetical protein